MITYTALTVAGFFGRRSENVLAEITVTQQEKEALRRVVRFHDLIR